MWFMKYVANPLVALILRSPLHGLLSASTVLITVRGRKSGKAYTLPVQYVQVGNTFYILPGMPEKKTWWRNLRGGAPVELCWQGRRLTGRGEVLQDALETAFGVLYAYFNKFPPSAKLHSVRSLPEGGFDPADVRREAQSAVIVRVLPDGKA